MLTESALQLGPHNSGRVWVGKTKQKGTRARRITCTPKKKDMHDAHSTCTPQATAHATSCIAPVVVLQDAGCLRWCLRACVLFTRQLHTFLAVQPLVHTYTLTSIKPLSHPSGHPETHVRFFKTKHDPPKATSAPLRPTDSHARATLSH